MRLETGGRFRRVILTKRWAIKLPRGAIGLRCNQVEAEVWSRVGSLNKPKLCPVERSFLWAFVVVMPRAAPATQADLDAYDNDLENRWWFVWTPEESGNYANMEANVRNVGWLNGVLVCFDYGGAPSH